MNEKPIELAESRRLEESEWRRANWKRWGPYLSERQWGTVREDYSSDGSCWDYFPYEHARMRAYRWGEDGLLGMTDRQCRLCFALALWNEKDSHLKERLYGLTNPQGNHGEDVKEQYFYLDSSPTHSYMKALYKYPQRAFPYEELLKENRKRGKKEDEYELVDTGVFDGNAYFDVYAEYAKAEPDDVLIRITLHNRADEPVRLHVLPTLWYRNTWSWGRVHDEGHGPEPSLRRADGGYVEAEHHELGAYRFHAAPASDGTEPTWLFTDNETNSRVLFDIGNRSPYTKDAFDRHVVHGEQNAVNPEQSGTKAAAWYQLEVPAQSSVTLHLRLHAEEAGPEQPFDEMFNETFEQRSSETDEYYDKIVLVGQDDPEQRRIARQAYAGLLWSKQFYHYVVSQWLEGDPAQPPPPRERWEGRNADWLHLYNRDVISMPDKWEYPWYAVWDLAFHTLPLARIDPRFAKNQLLTFLREWYMHPNGAIPAYEFNFSDVNPPVHAWACWRVYRNTVEQGRGDRDFLERAFQKLLLNFTWWVNRKDRDGKHIFSGGFLGLDNIGVFDRSQPLPSGAHLEQADGTAWMAFYCGTMLRMALELAEPGNGYEDMASKFFEHYVHIADAMNYLGGTGLWDNEDGFYYDRMHVDDETGMQALKVRSLVGLIPLISAEIIPRDMLDQLPGFRKRTDWFLNYRQDLAQHIAYFESSSSSNNGGGQYLLAIPSRTRLQRVLRYMLDENEFLSPYGIRSLSKYHEHRPFQIEFGEQMHQVDYEPGEARSELFGGNSNWRGPVWFPVNYLIIEALRRYHQFYGDSLRVECPTGSTRSMNLNEVADELSRRLTRLFLPDRQGQRPLHGHDSRFASDPHWRELVHFYEYFHAESGKGLGASHQTGWTALVTECMRELNPPQPRPRKRRKSAPIG